MGIGKKHDYPPLLAPGRHRMSLMEVKAAFVDPFLRSDRRRQLFQKFEEFFQAYLFAGFCCEIWLDGSFVTEKEEPSDVDATVMIEPEVGRILTGEQVALLEKTNCSGFGPEVDGFAYILLERSDPDFHDESANPASTWHEVYGSEHSKEWLKGFVVMQVRETDVGLRLRR